MTSKETEKSLCIMLDSSGSIVESDFRKVSNGAQKIFEENIDHYSHYAVVNFSTETLVSDWISAEYLHELAFYLNLYQRGGTIIDHNKLDKLDSSSTKKYVE